MTTAVVALIVCSGPLVRRFGMPVLVAGAGIGAVAARSLWSAVAALLVAGVVRVLAFWKTRRAVALRADRDVSELARGTLVAVSAGLSTLAAIDIAATHLTSEVRIEVERLQRSARQHGLAMALGDADGHCRRLFTVLARAQTTGASVAEALAAFVDEERERQRLSTTEAARRLPVKLTIPLALLILPGFVVLTVGPSVLESARRLLGPVVPIP